MIRKGRLEVKLGSHTILHAREKKQRKTPTDASLKPAPKSIRPKQAATINQEPF
jgi:hypothetical protein